MGDNINVLAKSSVVAFDNETGNIAWRYLAGGDVHGFSLDDDALYAGSGDGFVFSIDLLDGELLWRYETDVGEGFPSL